MTFKEQVQVLSEATDKLFLADICNATPTFICGVIDVANYIVDNYPEQSIWLDDLLTLSVQCETFCDDCDMFAYYCIQYIGKHGVEEFAQMMVSALMNCDAENRLTDGIAT